MIEQLKLYDVKSPKVRLGNEWDGGYVAPQIILDSSASLFSYGVGSDISFEIDYVRKTNKPSFSYDHTVEGAGIPHDLQHLMVFKKEGLSYQKETDLDTFFAHYEQSGIKEQVFLKMDIEGGEINILRTLSQKNLDKISVISIEILPSNTTLNFIASLNEFMPINYEFYRERRYGLIHRKIISVGK